MSSTGFIILGIIGLILAVYDGYMVFITKNTEWYPKLAMVTMLSAVCFVMAAT